LTQTDEKQKTNTKIKTSMWSLFQDRTVATDYASYSKSGDNNQLVLIGPHEV